ncbi:MAG: DUF4012 domain-containing protein [Actinobacteria bacterium]|nr:DUF4012 domain-containing protein [Actinomycetota bacterium]
MSSIRWQVAERLPLAGRTLDVIAEIVQTGDAALALAVDALERSEPFIAGEGFDIVSDEGRIDLIALREAGAAFGGIQSDRLADASERLAATPAAWLPSSVRDARWETLALARAAHQRVETTQALFPAVVGFLGGDGPRRYVLALQNNAELRGTGGFFGAFGALQADGGRLLLSDLIPAGEFYTDRAGESFVAVPAPRDFLDRYGHANASGFVTNVNLDPDLPTVAPVLLNLYEQRTGQRPDGVIVIDPVGLSILLAPVGPVTVTDPEFAQVPGLPNPVPPADVPRVTMVDAVQVLGGSGEDGQVRKEYLEAFAEAAFVRILAGGWEGDDMARAVARAASQRHLQIYSRREDEQRAFASAPAPGSMQAFDPSADLLALTAINAGANKQDVHVGHTLRGDVTLRPSGEAAVRESRLEIELENPLPDSGMDDTILGSSPPAVSMPTLRERHDGFNRTWFTIWAPQDSYATAVTDSAGEELSIGTGRIHGHFAVDHFLETPSSSSNHFKVDLEGPVQLEHDGPDLIYELTVWRQAKAIPDRLDITVSAPDGWSVVDVDVRGGGDGSGMGPFGELGPPVAAAADDDRVRISGDVNADLHIEIRFSRSLRNRFAEWLRQPVW